MEAEAAAVTALCAEAFEIRTATDPQRRAEIWRGRKSAFAAVGRISRDYIVQDGVIPRTALAEVLREIEELASVAGIRVANVFHAGDGNLHPLVLYDGQEPGALARAEEVSGAILELCVRRGGSITGEHGVGVDKTAKLPLMFSPEDLDTMHLLRCAFDEDGRANPGKVFPIPRRCAERGGSGAIAPAPRSGARQANGPTEASGPSEAGGVTRRAA